MNKIILYLLALCVFLVLVAFAADIKVTQAPVEAIKPSSSAMAIQQPDLIVKSVKVTGDPVVFSYSRTVMIPLEITIANLGSATTQDFNVGAEGWALDGNVYGFDFASPGTETMPERGGVLVHGIGAGPAGEKSFTGYLLLGPNPINAPMQPGTSWKIRAMVDYNLDPDAPYYEWGVSESNETNNVREITYPILATTLMRVDLKPVVAAINRT